MWCTIHFDQAWKQRWHSLQTFWQTLVIKSTILPTLQTAFMIQDCEVVQMRWQWDWKTEEVGITLGFHVNECDLSVYSNVRTLDVMTATAEERAPYPCCKLDTSHNHAHRWSHARFLRLSRNTHTCSSVGFILFRCNEGAGYTWTNFLTVSHLKSTQEWIPADFNVHDWFHRLWVGEF